MLKVDIIIAQLIKLLPMCLAWGLAVGHSFPLDLPILPAGSRPHPQPMSHLLSSCPRHLSAAFLLQPGQAEVSVPLIFPGATSLALTRQPEGAGPKPTTCLRLSAIKGLQSELPRKPLGFQETTESPQLEEPLRETHIWGPCLHTLEGWWTQASLHPHTRLVGLLISCRSTIETDGSAGKNPPCQCRRHRRLPVPS